MDINALHSSSPSSSSSSFAEYSLPLIMQIHIDDKYTSNLEKYLQKKIKNTNYALLMEYDRSIRFPLTVASSSSFIESMFLSDYMSSSLRDRVYCLNENTTNHNPLCSMESVTQPCHMYMTLVEEFCYKFNLNGSLTSYENYKMFTYDDYDTSYKENDSFYRSDLNLETKKSLSYHQPQLIQSTIESNKLTPTKIYIKDMSIQCDILKNSSLTSSSDSQIQTNQSVFNGSMNCFKPINLFNKSNVHDVGTTTDGIISETGLKAKHKSIRVMVRPQSRNVKLQTPLNMIPSNIMTGSNSRPMNKNLCISVDKTHQQQTPTITITNDTTTNSGNNKLVDYNNPRIPQVLPIDIDESVQSIESDSWIWPTTSSSVKSDKTLSQLISDTCNRHITQGRMNYQQEHTSDSLEETSNQNVVHLNGPISTECTSSKSTFDKEAHISLTIARYMEENLNNVEHDERFSEDEILQDLRRRRTNCISKMRIVMKQIHEREAQLLNNLNNSS
ncbi:unnamed protein product [Schistosoma turkestanicum]|nr:unnamed protein product [Schistosoma turkestanicum]